MIQKIKFSSLLLLLLLFSTQLKAVPAFPFPKTITQPDGTTLQLTLKGDEFFHYYATSDGIPLLINSAGVYQYARINAQGQLVDLGIKAKEPSARSLKEREMLKSFNHATDAANATGLMRTKRQQATPQNQAMRIPSDGNMRSLVILVNFSDLEFITPQPQEAFENMLNVEGYSENGGTGSARDYFIASSMGAFQPEFDVVGPYTLPNPMAFYGGNNPQTGSDQNPVQMIVDACTAASEDGVDFSIYDTDGDGFIDNIFVYYAGYNEAEWGPDDSVWPHRWGVYPTSIYNGGNYNGSVASITFNGKRLFDYACTSELRNNSGGNMAGIGTFVHEFGHVLGLPDLYATNGAPHHTLNSWSVMDQGSYLNFGRTPPVWSAYERFLIGFITPTLLNTTSGQTLAPLSTSNEAFLVSADGNHNLEGSSPSPKEFYLLENRQQAGWDKYLPGHGLLIYRIRHDQNKLFSNTVNNTESDMGVDIMEADGIASTSTFSGDPFPGIRRVSSYKFKLVSGVDYYMNLKQIRESSSQISFNFEKEVHILPDRPSLQFEADLGSTHSEEIIIETIHAETPLTCTLSGDEGNHFSLGSSDPLPAAGGSVVVNFTPTTAGTAEAFLQISTGTHTQNIALSGIGTYPLLQPVVPENTQNISKHATGFTAVWEAVEHAESYLLDVYTKEEADMSTIISENFNAVTNGSPNGSAGSVDISEDLDNFTQLPGWSGFKIYEAGGSLKLGSSTTLGHISTPAIDLSENGGSFQLQFKATAWKGDATSLKIYLDDVLVATAGELINDGSYEFKTYNFNLEGGTATSVLRFEGEKASRGRYLIDEIIISQLVVPRNAVEGSPFSIAETSFELQDLTVPNDYFYRVQAVSSVKVSPLSYEVGPIVLLSSSVENTDFQKLKATYSDGQLRFTTAGGVAFEIFNPMGQKLHSGVTIDGENSLKLSEESIVLLRVGSDVYKIKLR